MQIRVHGLTPREGDTAFAFLVLRLAAPVDRDGLIDLIGQLALLVPDAPTFATEVPHDCDAAMRLVGIPWSPPADDAAFEAQRQLIEAAGIHGIEEAWFFQTGTALPSVVPDPDADEADLDDDETYDAAADGDATYDADSDEAAADPDDDDEPDADETDDAPWSHGPPPQRATVPFPVDGYPDILEDLDGEDVGIAVKLAGPWIAGETTVLLGFHAMWLTPYGGRYRNARVTIDPVHHAAHFWVDRFAVPCSPEEQVHHLLWVASKLDEVLPVVHARFVGATLAEKHGDPDGDLREAFVLGGNPLLAVHARDGDAGVDAWMAAQTTWSGDEIAPMLRELAIDLVTRRAIPVPAAAAADDLPTADRETEANVSRLRARQLTAYAGELLTTRAYLGKLDRRAADHLRPALAAGATYEPRRTAIVAILGALRDRDSVPALIRILETTPIASALDAIAHQDLVAATARALGMIADPRAIPALTHQVSAPGPQHDEPRLSAALALSGCMAASANPPELPAAVFDALLRNIRDIGDDQPAVDLRVAYNALASRLPPARRDRALLRLHAVHDELPTAGRSGVAALPADDSDDDSTVN